MTPRRPFALAVSFALAAALASACDVRPLTSHELYVAKVRPDGAVPDAGAAGTGGVAPPDADRQDEGAAGTGGLAGMVGAAGADGGAGTGGAPDADAGPTGCRIVCPVGSACDEQTQTCAPITGTGMLGGVIRDKCTGQAIGALVGIARRHTCSYPLKGSYFFTALPFGTLELAVAKDGYRLYHAPVTIVAGGVVVEVELERLPLDGGADPCTGPPPSPPNDCSCTTPTCIPP